LADGVNLGGLTNIEDTLHLKMFVSTSPTDVVIQDLTVSANPAGWSVILPATDFPKNGEYTAIITDPISGLTASQIFIVDAAPQSWTREYTPRRY
jgi:hypothetical protein